MGCVCALLVDCRLGGLNVSFPAFILRRAPFFSKCWYPLTKVYRPVRRRRLFSNNFPSKLYIWFKKGVGTLVVVTSHLVSLKWTRFQTEKRNLLLLLYQTRTKRLVGGQQASIKKWSNNTRRSQRKKQLREDQENKVRSKNFGILHMPMPDNQNWSVSRVWNRIPWVNIKRSMKKDMCEIKPVFFKNSSWWRHPR